VPMMAAGRPAAALKKNANNKMDSTRFTEKTTPEIAALDKPKTGARVAVRERFRNSGSQSGDPWAVRFCSESTTPMNIATELTIKMA